jgi:hypothetical protein
MNIKGEALWPTLPLGMFIAPESSADVKGRLESNRLSGWLIKS